MKVPVWTSRSTERKRTCTRKDQRPHQRSLGMRLEGAMVLLKAIFRPDRLDAVKEALLEVGATGMTVTEGRGHGQQKGHTAVYRGKEYDVTLLPKMQVEVVVPDHLSLDAV